MDKLHKQTRKVNVNMIGWKLYYERYYSDEELKPIQTKILQGKDFDDLLDEDDFNLLEESYIELAKQLGWNSTEFFDDVIEEQANLVLSYDGEISESLSKLMGNAAIEYVENYMDEQKEPALK